MLEKQINGLKIYFIYLNKFNFIQAINYFNY